MRFPDVAPTASNYLEITATSYDDAYAKAMAAAQGGMAYIAAQVGSDVVVFDPQFDEAVVLTGARLTDISVGNIQSSAAPPSPVAPGSAHATFSSGENEVTTPTVIGPTESFVLAEGAPGADSGGIHTAIELGPLNFQPDPTFRNEGNIELDGSASFNDPILMDVSTVSFWENNVIENDGRMYVAAFNHTSILPDDDTFFPRIRAWDPGDILVSGYSEHWRH